MSRQKLLVLIVSTCKGYISELLPHDQFLHQKEERLVVVVPFQQKFVLCSTHCNHRMVAVKIRSFLVYLNFNVGLEKIRRSIKIFFLRNNYQKIFSVKLICYQLLIYMVDANSTLLRVGPYSSKIPNCLTFFLHLQPSI